jgi:hypothetical protein
MDGGNPPFQRRQPIDERPVEWRVSRCNTTDHTYVAQRG